MTERPVSVYALELRSYQPPEAVLYVHCSKGTYIRSLARDIGIAAGSRAHLIALNRTSIAGFQLSDATASGSHEIRPIDIKSFETLGLPYVIVPDEVKINMIHGKPLRELIVEEELQGLGPNASQEAAGVFSQDREFVGILEKKAGMWRYGYVYARD
jgi:tRNA pseudouridine55 synthase